MTYGPFLPGFSLGRHTEAEGLSDILNLVDGLLDLTGQLSTMDTRPRMYGVARQTRGDSNGCARHDDVDADAFAFCFQSLTAPRSKSEGSQAQGDIYWSSPPVGHLPGARINAVRVVPQRIMMVD